MNNKNQNSKKKPLLLTLAFLGLSGAFLLGSGLYVSLSKKSNSSDDKTNQQIVDEFIASLQKTTWKADIIKDDKIASEIAKEVNANVNGTIDKYFENVVKEKEGFEIKILLEANDDTGSLTLNYEVKKGAITKTTTIETTGFKTNQQIVDEFFDEMNKLNMEPTEEGKNTLPSNIKSELENKQNLAKYIKNYPINEIIEKGIDVEIFEIIVSDKKGEIEITLTLKRGNYKKDDFVKKIKGFLKINPSFYEPSEEMKKIISLQDLAILQKNYFKSTGTLEYQWKVKENNLIFERYDGNNVTERLTYDLKQDFDNNYRNPEYPDKKGFIVKRWISKDNVSSRGDYFNPNDGDWRPNFGGQEINEYWYVETIQKRLTEYFEGK